MDINLVPRAFPLKNGWAHPFFKGKALGTRLDGYSFAFPYTEKKKLLIGVYQDN